MLLKTFSLRTLLVIVSLSCVSVIALKSANGTWATLFTSSLAIVLFVAIVGALFDDTNRCFWSGFAIFGWGYLFLIYGWVSFSDGNMLTTTLLWRLADAIDNSYSPDAPSYPYALAGEQGPTPDFLRIGHALWAFAFSMLGGVAAHFFSTRKRER